jgi:hypothetical protein
VASSHFAPFSIVPSSEAPVKSAFRKSAPVTKEYGSSWIFELCLTWANGLQRVQRSVFSLVRPAQHPAACALAITLEPEPAALRSTRNRPRRAVRRGAAWPAERPSSWLVVREAVSRWQVAHRRAVMVAKRRRRCPQEHGGVAQRAPAGHGGPGGADAAVPSSACRCPRPASGVQCLVRVSSSTRACPRGRCAVSGAGV